VSRPNPYGSRKEEQRASFIQCKNRYQANSEPAPERQQALLTVVNRRPTCRSIGVEPGVRDRCLRRGGIFRFRSGTSVRRSWRSAGAPPSRRPTADRGPVARRHRWRFRIELLQPCLFNQLVIAGFQEGATGQEPDPRTTLSSACRTLFTMSAHAVRAAPRARSGTSRSS
jgi:hypothetical protein